MTCTKAQVQSSSDSEEGVGSGGHKLGLELGLHHAVGQREPDLGVLWARKIDDYH